MSLVQEIDAGIEQALNASIGVHELIVTQVHDRFVVLAFFDPFEEDGEGYQNVIAGEGVRIMDALDNLVAKARKRG